MQRSKALAADVAQTKLDQLRSVAYNDLRPLNTTDTVTEGGIPFTVVSTASAVSQTSAPTGCSNSRARDYVGPEEPGDVGRDGRAQAGRAADVDRGPRRGRRWSRGQRERAAQGQNVPNIPLSLASGSVSAGNATTDASGCARWDAVNAGSGYALTGAVPGYVQPNGENAVSITGINIAAEDAAEKSFAYDRGGAVRVRFRQKRSDSDTIVNVDPGFIPHDLSGCRRATRSPSRSSAVGTSGDAGATGVASLLPVPVDRLLDLRGQLHEREAQRHVARRRGALDAHRGRRHEAVRHDGALDLLLPNLNVKVHERQHGVEGQEQS